MNRRPILMLPNLIEDSKGPRRKHCQFSEVCKNHAGGGLGRVFRGWFHGIPISKWQRALSPPASARSVGFNFFGGAILRAILFYRAF